MIFRGGAIFGGILLMVSPLAAQACGLRYGLDLADVIYADVVVIGRASYYRIEELALPGTRDTHTFARFDIQVDRVLKGEAPAIIPTALGRDPAHSIPEKMTAELQLFALHNQALGSPRPPHSDLGTLRPLVELVEQFNIMDAPCAPPFILDALGAEASEVTGVLALEK